MTAGRSKRRAAAGAATLLAALGFWGSAAALELPFGRKDPAKAGPSGYDVAGVRIGDSDREAETALTAAGWTLARAERRPCAQGDAPPPPAGAPPAATADAAKTPPRPPGCVQAMELRRDRDGLREGLKLDFIEDPARPDRLSSLWRAQYMSEGVFAFTPNQFLEHATKKYGRPALSGVDGVFGWGKTVPQDKGPPRLDRANQYLLVDALRGAVLLEDPALRDGKAKVLAEKFKSVAPDPRPGAAQSLRPGF